MSEYLEKLEKCRTCENDMALASNYKQSQITTLTQRNTELENKLAVQCDFTEQYRINSQKTANRLAKELADLQDRHDDRMNCVNAYEKDIGQMECKHAELVEAVKGFVSVSESNCFSSGEYVSGEKEKYSHALDRVTSLIEKEV